MRQACAEQMAPLPDALLEEPQVLRLRRRVQPNRHAEDARQEAAPHRHTTVLLWYPGQRVAPRRRPARRTAAQAGAAQTGEVPQQRPLMIVLPDNVTVPNRAYVYIIIFHRSEPN